MIQVQQDGTVFFYESPDLRDLEKERARGKESYSQNVSTYEEERKTIYKWTESM